MGKVFRLICLGKAVHRYTHYALNSPKVWRGNPHLTLT